ncbi:MAG TPA: peptidylprolyl isomerase [Rhodocyclaceae bacterium]|nr:peptidylprolyl isomerase [Rhodocyclaceae bacterium]
MRTKVLMQGMLGAGLSVLLAFPAVAKKEILTPFQDDRERMDPFVSRSGPDDSRMQEFKLGHLGVLLPSYGREPLYLAYRAMKLGRPALEKQNADTPKKKYQDDPPPSGGLPIWLEQRRLVAGQELPREIDPYRSFEGNAYGKYLNCADGAFNFAASTLKAMLGNPKLNRADIQEWVAGQDLVFDLCGDPAPGNASPTLPAALATAKSLYFRQLRQYQVATANFYAGKYGDALVAFDAIAKDKTHPMSVWASHAALRTLLRTGSLDASLAQGVREIRARPDSLAQKREALAAAEIQYRKKMAQIYSQIGERSKAILADKTRSLIHDPVRKLLVQAGPMIVPDQLLTESSVVLGRFNKDVERSEELSEWGALADKLLDYGQNAQLNTYLRNQHEYFDWIRTIQACADNPLSPNFTDRCPEEHAHALKKWQLTKANTWLVASLVTAQGLTPGLDAALAAARQIKADAPEYLTVRYHLVRLLRLAGQQGEAKKLLDEMLQPPAYTLAANGVRSMRSENNLFRQERLALAQSEQEVLPYLLRDASQQLAADGDELLNRRLATKDLLRLAKSPLVDGKLRKQLLVAAWWRGDMTGNAALAEEAARMLAETEPRLSSSVASYLKTNDVEERRYLLAKTALEYRISPLVFGVSTDLAGRRKRGEAADWWCSFNSEDFKKRAVIQRTPGALPELTTDIASRDAEIAQLNKIGSAADWLVQVALKRARENPRDPLVRPMLEAVIATDEVDCHSPQADASIASAREALSAIANQRQLPANASLNSEQFLARVNGRAIPRAPYLVLIDMEINKGTPDNAKLRSLAKEEIILKEILAMEATSRGLGKLPDPYGITSRDDGNRYLAELTAVSNAYVTQFLAEQTVSEERLRGEYDAIIKKLGNKEYRVRHILVVSESEARSIIEMLKKGSNFSELAMKSIDHGSRDKGGDLSWNGPNVFVAPFSDAMIKLEKGRYTETPVKTQFGYHVIRVDDVRELRPPSYEEVRGRLLQPIRQDLLLRHFSELRNKAKVD